MEPVGEGEAAMSRGEEVMALGERLQRLFGEGHAAYRLVPHTEAFTAAATAATSHIPGRELAKVVLLRTEDGSLLMVALPTPAWLDLGAMARATGRRGLRLATEAEFEPRFPDCEAGAMPPFGRLYGLPLYLDPCLAAGPEIAFQAGNHHEVVVMEFAEYERLARPVVASRCLHRARSRVAS
jgi:Ala-tRNA(Pro) deacylase